MKISKIRVQNYKLLKDVCVPTNPDINVFVGENDAGKSTLLEVISIITSGKLNGYAFSRQIKDNMFNIRCPQCVYSLSQGYKAICPASNNHGGLL